MEPPNESNFIFTCPECREDIHLKVPVDMVEDNSSRYVQIGTDGAEKIESAVRAHFSGVHGGGEEDPDLFRIG